MRSGVYLVSIIIYTLFAQGGTGARGSHADEPPAVRAAVAPQFPPLARASRQQGDVVVEVTVDPEGRVQSAEALSGDTFLRKACVDAAKSWEFAPPRGAPGRTVKLIFNFGYGDGGKDIPEYVVTFVPPYTIEIRWSPRPLDYQAK